MRKKECCSRKRRGKRRKNVVATIMLNDGGKKVDVPWRLGPNLIKKTFRGGADCIVTPKTTRYLIFIPPVADNRDENIHRL
jgi:hypothetical protein